VGFHFSTTTEALLCSAYRNNSSKEMAIFKSKDFIFSWLKFKLEFNYSGRIFNLEL
jgi:hypothetical protein